MMEFVSDFVAEQDNAAIIKVVGVGGGLTLITQCFSNHSRSNVKEGNAEMLNTMVEVNDLATPEGKHTKR